MPNPSARDTPIESVDRSRGLTVRLPVQNYDLGATLDSGQAFRWHKSGDAWEGVIGTHWVRLIAHADAIHADVAEPVADWHWLRHYLQTEIDLDAIASTFPRDDAMTTALTTCRGLRLLRQDPWETLASFILSSSKQIVQIRQIVDVLCETWGAPVAAGNGQGSVRAFPTAQRLADATEYDLRACKMGFRAPNLLATAQRVASGAVDLEALRALPYLKARERLIELPGVGPKIADCVLLFGYGFPEAFPIDVWVRKALMQMYFAKRKISPLRLARFIETHFGPHRGYAQQYLFHHIRTQSSRGK